MSDSAVKPRGLTVRHVDPQSPSWRAGIRAGDRITHVDGVRVDHELDFTFALYGASCEMTIARNAMSGTLTLNRRERELPGLEIAPKPVRRCRNKCLFCFISQMPPGLRRSLYVRDEDIRHSFMHGNFVTLSQRDNPDLVRAIEMRLSPLYVSVHATDESVRKRLLANPTSRPILESLNELRRSGIRFHTQIVLCPGFNDGTVLRKTVRDLLAFGESLLSIGVVPVGLTKYHRGGLRAVSPQDALTTVNWLNAEGERLLRKGGKRLVYAADEFFIKAGLAIPGTSYYEGFPQSENGIGLICQMLAQWRGVSRSLQTAARTRLPLFVATSVLAYPYIKKICATLSSRYRREIETVPVENGLFGPGVTVAGLLCARDILMAVRERRKAHGSFELVVPGVMYNTRGVTLDGFSAERLQRAAGCRVRVANTVSELADIASGWPHTKRTQT